MKKFIQFCVLLLTFLVTVPSYARVGESFSSGFCYFTVQSENPNTVYITGWNKSNELSGEIILPDKVINNGEEYIVTGIAGSDSDKGVFQNCPFTTVTVPEAYTFIGSQAFEFSEQLEEVKISNPKTYLDSWVFYSCSNLKRVNLPDSLTVIRGHLFGGCKSLEEIVLPENLEMIEWYAFSGCAFSNISIPSKVTRIFIGAFTDCPIEHLSINSNVSLIDLLIDPISDEFLSVNASQVFSLDSLKSLIYGDNVTTLPSFLDAKFGFYSRSFFFALCISI